jgi:hypothetical protein
MKRDTKAEEFFKVAPSKSTAEYPEEMNATGGGITIDKK